MSALIDRIISAVFTILGVIAVILCIAFASSVFGQTSGAISPDFAPVYTNATGTGPAALGYICTFAAGTTTLKYTYQDADLTTDNQNPIRLNAAGRPVNGSTLVSIYLGQGVDGFGALNYKFSIYANGTGNTCNGTTVGALIRSVDNVYDMALLLANGLISPVTFDVFSAKDINQVRKCDKFTGADIGAQIDACVADLPSTGGVADARGIISGTLSSTLTLSKANVRLLLGGPFTQTASINVTANGVDIVCNGQNSPITYTPAAGGTAVKFSNGASELFFGSLQNCYYVGTNAQKKIGVELVDTSNIFITGNHFNLSGSTNNNEGIKLEGRESTYITGNYVQADQPLHVSDDPNTNIDSDFFTLLNNEWIGPITGTPAAAILIDSGVNITRWTAIHNVMVGGAGAQWIDTTSAQISDEMTWIDVFCEQQPVATSYCIDIEHNDNLYNLKLQGIRIPSTGRGIKLRKVVTVNISNYLYDGTGVAFDIDSSVDDLSHDNVQVYSGSATVTIAATHRNGCLIQNGTKRCYYNNNLIGTTTNDSAPTGVVGEYISSTVAFGASVSLSSGSSVSITSISLTAGDWDVQAVGQYTPAAATSITQLVQTIGPSNTCLTDPANAGGAPGNFSAFVTAANVFTAADPVLPTPVSRVSIASTTTVCLILKGIFTVDTLRGYGFISARRVR